MGTVELKAFIEFLKDNLGFVFDVDRFDHRIMLQKYMFLVQLLDWGGKPYYYNIYMHGPYSPELAKDYYNLGTYQIGNGRYKAHLPIFNQTKFIQVVQGKGVDWLEIGATLLSLYNNNVHRMTRAELVPFVFERAKEIKSNFDDRYIANIFYELEQYGLLRLNSS
jgi:uncharacterized protein YwgA